MYVVLMGKSHGKQIWGEEERGYRKVLACMEIGYSTLASFPGSLSLRAQFLHTTFERKNCVQRERESLGRRLLYIPV